MPSQRPDAQIAPFLTHLTTHHGVVTLIPADNNGRRRKAKGNPPVATASPRAVQRDSPTRFTALQSPSPRPASSGGLLSRIRRISRPDESLDDIPGYPPPSFEEAMATPAVSVCSPSTTTLGRFAAPQASHHNLDRDSDSDSDDDTLSLDVVDAASLPTPRASPLQTRPLRGRGILDSDPDDTGYALSAVNNRAAHRRHMSLSPLRTLFPSRSNNRESAYSNTPLGYARGSPHSRSTTSLLVNPNSPPSPPASPSVRSENVLGSSRRFFHHSHKGQRASEALDSWEIVESQEPLDILETSPPERAPSPLQNEIMAPTSVVASTPPWSTRSEKSAAIISQLTNRERPPPAPVAVAPLVVSLPPLPPPPPRSPPIVTVRSRIPPAPSSPPPTPIADGPPQLTVRTKKPPPPKRRPQSSPLRSTHPPDLDLNLAASIPLPLTPVTGSPTSSFSIEPVSFRALDCVPSQPFEDVDGPMPDVLPLVPSKPPASGADSDLGFSAILNNFPTPPSSPLVREYTHRHTMASSTASPMGSTSSPIFPRIPSPPASFNHESASSSSSAIDSEGRHHHYPGRPLPVRPRVVVDSTYAAHPAFPPVEIPLRPPHVPEGLLINLDEDADDLELETPVARPHGFAQPGPLIADDIFDDDTPTSTPQTYRRPTPHVATVPEPSTGNRQSSASSVVELAAATTTDEFLDVTDLDMLLAQIEDDQRQRDGSNYEALLLMSDFIGPAAALSPGSGSGLARANPGPGGRVQINPHAPPILAGTIDVARRRVLKDGRVKLKLEFSGGSGVDRCGICMSQFRQGQRALMCSGGDGHAFHAQCLGRWMVKSRTCPLCRVELGVMKEQQQQTGSGKGKGKGKERAT